MRVFITDLIEYSKYKPQHTFSALKPPIFVPSNTKMEEFIMKNEITYTQINDINYPNLALPEQPKVNIGKYGQMRLDFLKKHRRGTYTTLLTECRLTEHLSDIDQEARSQFEIMTAELAKQRGIDETIKATNPLLWVQEMNNCLVSA